MPTMGYAGKTPQVRTQLPPPPAPTSRDANPWTMPGDRPQVRIPGLGIDPVRVSLPKSPGVLRDLPAPGPASPSAPKASPLRWVPSVILGIVFLAVANTARDAYRSGDIVGALIPLFMVAVVASGFFRALRKDRR
jgi:hypothetical protein